MKNLIFILTVMLTAAVYPQNTKLYMPIEYQDAYNNKTRAYDGNPGEKYWQNSSDYHIKVEVLPEDYTINGSETITYRNNSPDRLDRIVFNLVPDVYKKGNPRDYPISPIDVTGGVKIHTFVLNGDTIKSAATPHTFRREGTVMMHMLDQPMMPDTAYEIYIEWSYKLPIKSTIRQGVYSQNDLFAAYWFPQIAVYDDIYGWDFLGHTIQQEFYNDFSDFEVEITVPGNFIVWATGELQNASDVLHHEALGRWNDAQTSDKVVNIISQKDRENGTDLIDREKSTWIFKAKYVPDFAFGCSDDYLWDGASVVVDEESGRRVFVSAGYNRESEDFYEVAALAADAVKWFSTEMPGVPYPWPSMTVFNGSGGMEFPMIVNDGSTSTWNGTMGVTTHEIAHTYFPFYTGTNEKRHAWMDEGWAVFLPFDYQIKYGEQFDPILRAVETYLAHAGKEYEMPIATPSYMLVGSAYRIPSYYKSAMAYYIMQDFLGPEVFKEALQEFINNWNGRHPSPYDFFYTFNRVAGEDLSWFWQPWFFQRGYPDLQIVDAALYPGESVVTIENTGNLPLPIHLKATYENGEQEEKYFPADIWKDGQSRVHIKFESDQRIDFLDIGNLHIPDMNRSDTLITVE